MNRYRAFRTLAKFALILSAIVVAQGILSLRLRVFNYFDLPLIYSIYYGFTLGSPAGSIAIGSVLGLLQDSMSGAILGTNGFTKTLIGFLSASAVTRFDVEQPITRVFGFVVFTFLDLTVKELLALLSDTGSASAPVFGAGLGFWVLSAAFNVLFGLILFGYRSRFGHASA